MRVILFLGRLFFSIIFILASFGHFTPVAAEYAASHGVPMPNILVPISGVMALVGGLSILTGFKARFGAWLIVLFLIPVTLMMHNFWAVEDSISASLQQTMFFKNLAMLGGALIITQFGVKQSR